MICPNVYRYFMYKFRGANLVSQCNHMNIPDIPWSITLIFPWGIKRGLSFIRYRLLSLQEVQVVQRHRAHPLVPSFPLLLVGHEVPEGRQVPGKHIHNKQLFLTLQGDHHNQMSWFLYWTDLLTHCCSLIFGGYIQSEYSGHIVRGEGQ